MDLQLNPKQSNSVKNLRSREIDIYIYVILLLVLQSGGAGEPAGGNGNGNGAGRAALRGGAREARPGAGAVAMPTQQLSQMSIGTGDASSRRERKPVSYSEPNTRPAHITDKCGMLLSRLEKS